MDSLDFSRSYAVPQCADLARRVIDVPISDTGGFA